MRRVNRTLSLLVLSGACLVGLAGCQPGWFSGESDQGKKLQKMQQEKKEVKVEVPADWPYHFMPVQVQKRFTDESGTQFRAVTAWQLRGRPADVLPFFTRLLGDQPDRRLELLILRVRYHDANGREIGSEVVNVSPHVFTETVSLRDFAKHNGVASIRVTLESGHWTTPVQPLAQ